MRRKARPAIGVIDSLSDAEWSLFAGMHQSDPDKMGLAAPARLIASHPVDQASAWLGRRAERLGLSPEEYLPPSSGSVHGR